MQRIRATITYATSGAPGVITLYTRSTGLENGPTAQLTCDRLKNALFSGRALFTTDTTFTSDTFVDNINPATGQITDSFNITPWTVVGFSGTSYLPPATAICLTWKTAAIVNGRRVRGRTFLSPIASANLEANGSPTSGAMTNAQAIASSWVDNGLTDTFAVVWHRPVNGAGGTAEDITSTQVRDKFAVLRSRRD